MDGIDTPVGISAQFTSWDVDIEFVQGVFAFFSLKPDKRAPTHVGGDPNEATHRGVLGK